jgi:A/G-specific adenine glycosylase
MDYGTYLKKTYPNPSRKSKHHSKQSTFKGSKRQLRGFVLRELAQKPRTLQWLKKNAPHDSFDIREIIKDLHSEGLIRKKDSQYLL